MTVAADMDVLLLQGQDMIEQLGRAHQEAWGLGSADRWGLDQGTGRLTWNFPGRTAEAPAQILATHDPADGMWTWAWANASLLPQMCVDAESVRGWGQANIQPMLTTAQFQIGEEQAGELAALAVRLTTATGYYRAPAGPLNLYLTFGPVTVTTPTTDPQTFTITH